MNQEINPLIRLSKSVIGEGEMREVRRILENGFLGMGPETQKFEQELAGYIGGDREVCCVNTGTAALHLALQACGIGTGDEVLVPSLTFVATFQAISATGAVPVACDVDEAAVFIDVNDARRKLTSRTKAVLPVHYASAVGDLEGVYQLAKEHGLRVIEDAAHAFGGTYRGKKIGGAGDIICFSFDGIKNITSGEGGAVVTGDRTIIEYVQDARLLGVVKDTESRYRRERSWEFDVTHQGFRYHMSDIMAAIGRVQLRRLETEFTPKRRELAAYYRKRLAGMDGVSLFEGDLESIVPHIMPVRIHGGLRDAARRALTDINIQTGIQYKPNHLLAYYGGGKVKLPVAEKLYEELLTLPLHPELDNNGVDKIVMSLGAVVSGGKRGA